MASSERRRRAERRAPCRRCSTRGVCATGARFRRLPPPRLCPRPATSECSLAATGICRLATIHAHVAEVPFSVHAFCCHARHNRHFPAPTVVQQPSVHAAPCLPSFSCSDVLSEHATRRTPLIFAPCEAKQRSRRRCRVVLKDCSGERKARGGNEIAATWKAGHAKRRAGACWRSHNARSGGTCERGAAALVPACDAKMRRFMSRAML